MEHKIVIIFYQFCIVTFTTSLIKNIQQMHFIVYTQFVIKLPNNKKKSPLYKHIMLCWNFRTQWITKPGPLASSWNSQLINKQIIIYVILCLMAGQWAVSLKKPQNYLFWVSLQSHYLPLSLAQPPRLVVRAWSASLVGDISKLEKTQSAEKLLVPVTRGKF